MSSEDSFDVPENLDEILESAEKRRNKKIYL